LDWALGTVYDVDCGAKDGGGGIDWSETRRVREVGGVEEVLRGERASVAVAEVDLEGAGVADEDEIVRVWEWGWGVAALEVSGDGVAADHEVEVGGGAVEEGGLDGDFAGELVGLEWIGEVVRGARGGFEEHAGAAP
jgi:hypothetical protein